MAGKSNKKKRTITPEQQAKMQAGRQRAKVHEKRVASANELENKMKEAQRNASQTTRLRRTRRRRFN